MDQDQGQDQDQEQNQQSDFEKLNWDCCDMIFRRLKIEDLCALSFTCTRLQEICVKKLQKVYPTNVMRIEGIQNDGTFLIGPKNEMYTTYFDKSVGNIVLNGFGLKSKLHVVNAFYKKNEVVVKEIHFKDWGGNGLNRAGFILVDVLKSVETITFNRVKLDDDLYYCILQYVPKIKHLIFRDTNFCNADWIQHTYPQLESLQWHASCKMNGMYITNEISTMMNVFRAFNPNVKLSFASLDVNLIGELMATDLMIEEMFFDHLFQDGRSEWSDIYFLKFNVLIKLKSQFEHVKLHLLINNSSMVKDLELIQSNVIGLHWNTSIGTDLIKMCTFEHLQFLRIDLRYSSVENEFKDVFTKVPNLIEAYFDDITGWNFDPFHDALLAAVGQSTKLSNIFLRGESEPIKKIDFPRVNQVREELEDAKPLKIYIYNSYPFFAADPIGKGIQKFKVIEILPVSGQLSNYPFFLDLD